MLVDIYKSFQVFSHENSTETQGQDTNCKVVIFSLTWLNKVYKKQWVQWTQEEKKITSTFVNNLPSHHLQLKCYEVNARTAEQKMDRRKRKYVQEETMKEARKKHDF